MLLPSDIAGFCLGFLAQDQPRGFVKRFMHQARKLINWGLKSAKLAAPDYFAFTFAVLFTLFEYQDKAECLEKLVRYLVQDYLPRYLSQALGLSFDSLFERRQHSKEK